MDPSQITELKASFAHDGFVVIPGFVSAADVDEIRARAEAAAQRMPNKSGQFTNVTKGLEQVDDYFAELLENGPHVPILEALLGRTPEPTTASFFTKDKHSEEFHPHSDAMEGGVVWVALDETDAENGCLHFLNGSHKREAEFAHLQANTPTDLSDHPDKSEVAMKPGDTVFFRPTTVHWSGPNKDGSLRRGFNCFYTGNPFKHLSKEDWEKLKEKKKQAARAATSPITG